MSTYLINFIVYTTAMIGIIFLAVIVYKKFYCINVSKSKFLNVEDSIAIGPRKNIYVLRAGSERFLVASDAERTSLISKLDNSPKIEDSSVEDLPVIVDFQKAKEPQKEPKKVFKNIINNL